ncbi:MAG: hypothetical protein ABW110_24535 [Steroidobacteraceae bacterium]
MTVARPAPWMRSLSPFLWSAVAGAAAYVIWSRLEHIDGDQVWLQVQSLTPRAITLAAFSCLLSYVLVGVYEGLAVLRASGRHLHAFSFLTAWIANPIAHMVGLAAVSGGALRYRLYSSIGLSRRQIAGTVLLTTLPYVLGITASITTVLLLESKVVAQLLHVPAVLARSVGILIALTLAGYVLLNHYRTEPVRLGALHFPLPGVRLTVLQILFGAAETMLVATVLFMCMPQELELYWLQFIGAYMLALLLAQSSHVPAGLGVLEASMLVLLPGIPPGKLIGAMLAYRFIFEFVPLLIALLLLVGREGYVRGWWRAPAVATD